jgi:hypothetical protein
MNEKIKALIDYRLKEAKKAREEATIETALANIRPSDTS